MTQVFCNNIRTTLVSPVAPGDTTVNVSSSAGMPVPSGGLYFLITLANVGAETTWEIMKVTARTGGVLTVVRAQDGTTALAWPTGSKVESRWTRGSADRMVQADPYLTPGKLSYAVTGGSLADLPATYNGTKLQLSTPLGIDASMGLEIEDGAPDVTAEKLYQVGGLLQFNGSPIGSAVRANVPHTTALLANNAQETSIINLSKTCDILKVVTDYPARVRLYLTSAQRDADAVRPVELYPSGTHGMVLEVVTTNGELAINLAPIPTWASTDGTVVAYLTVTNLSGATVAITTTFTILAVEN